MFIDSHAHLDDPKFESDFRAVLDRASEAKVEKVLVIGNGVASSKVDSAISIASNSKKNIKVTALFTIKITYTILARTHSKSDRF